MTTIKCGLCNTTLTAARLQLEQRREALGWSKGIACSRGRHGRGCQPIYVCPNCLAEKVTPPSLEDFARRGMAAQAAVDEIIEQHEPGESDLA